MKKLLIFLLILTQSVFAQSLKQDFSCVGLSNENEQIEISINNIDFVKEVSIKNAKKACTLAITGGSYSERSVSPQLLIDFDKRDSCAVSKKLVTLKEGFLKIMINEDSNEAFALILVDHQPIRCKIKSFNQKKMINRINNL